MQCNVQKINDTRRVESPIYGNGRLYETEGYSIIVWERMAFVEFRENREMFTVEKERFSGGYLLYPPQKTGIRMIVIDTTVSQIAVIPYNSEGSTE